MINHTDILKKEFFARRERNNSYSLRAFARDLEISPASLCQVLSNKNGLSESRAKHIARKLNLTQEDTKLFCNLVAATCARSQLQRNTAKKNLCAAAYELDEESLTVFSSWEYAAILEMARLAGMTVKTAAQRLKIKLSECWKICQVLVDQGLISIESDVLHRIHNSIMMGGKMPSLIVRHLHQGILEKAKYALNHQSFEKKEFCADFLKFNSRDLPEAKDMILQFRRDFDKKFGHEDNADRVYCLSMQFFDVMED